MKGYVTLTLGSTDTPGRSRCSRVLPKKSTQPNLLQGTLDLLILHALQREPLHGYAIAQTIHLRSDEVLRVEEGSLYPALYRLELDGAVAASWGASGKNHWRKPIGLALAHLG